VGNSNTPLACEEDDNNDDENLIILSTGATQTTVLKSTMDIYPITITYTTHHRTILLKRYRVYVVRGATFRMFRSGRFDEFTRCDGKFILDTATAYFSTFDARGFIRDAANAFFSTSFDATQGLFSTYRMYVVHNAAIRTFRPGRYDGKFIRDAMTAYFSTFNARGFIRYAVTAYFSTFDARGLFMTLSQGCFPPLDTQGLFNTQGLVVMQNPGCFLDAVMINICYAETSLLDMPRSRTVFS
jgi:hypothetical protein